MRGITKIRLGVITLQDLDDQAEISALNGTDEFFFETLLQSSVYSLRSQLDHSESTKHINMLKSVSATT